MVQIQQALCIGCGICRDNCHQGAISIINRKVVIDMVKCDNCGFCLNICPRGAINGKSVKIDTEKTENLFGLAHSLTQKANDISEKLEKLRYERNNLS